MLQKNSAFIFGLIFISILMPGSLVKNPLCRSKSQGNHVRQTRGLNNFECVVECATGLLALTNYVGYGCWCGFGGSGEPVDDIDRCCMNHDLCYDAAKKKHNCGLITEYTSQYGWTCEPNNNTTIHSKGIPTCCPDNKPGCGAALCECDTQAALCFANYKYPGTKPGCTH